MSRRQTSLASAFSSTVLARVPVTGYAPTLTT
jgi:hypothetical protein